MREITWGIIGCGSVTEIKSGPAFSRVGGSRLAAVMRRDAEKAKDYALRHNVPRWYCNIDDFLSDPEINAVYIATPPNTHCALTLQALASGRPVLVEKPMALNTNEATRMVEAAEQADLPLFIAYYKRSLPRLEAMRNLIQAGDIGEVRAIVVTHTRPQHFSPRQSWKLDPAINGGGLFVDAQVHTLDWLDHCFGPPSEVQGLIRCIGECQSENLVSYNLAWMNGLVASGMYCFGASPKTDSLTVYGTAGSASTAFFSGSEIIVNYGDGDLQTISLPDPPHVHEPLIERIVEHLQGGRQAPSLGYDALRTTQLVDRLYADFRS